MFDIFEEGLRWLVLLALGLPIVYTLGHGIKQWWLEPLWQEKPPEDSEAATAKVKDLGIVQDDRAQRLPVKNVGSGLAREVHVYLNNRPITDFRSGARAEQHPIPKLEPGDQHSYQIATGPAARGERVRLRIEWEDASGEHVQESVVMAP